MLVNKNLNFSVIRHLNLLKGQQTGIHVIDRKNAVELKSFFRVFHGI